MDVKPISYLNWAKTSFHGISDAIDLASSGFPSRSIEDIDPRPDSLQITAPNSYGLPPLREALGAHHGLSGAEVVITAGASMANFLVHMHLLNPGDTLLLEDPAYEPLRNLPALFGAKVSPLVRREENGWNIDPDDLERAFSKTGAKVAVVSDPHNPSGARMGVDRLRTLIEIAARHKATLVVDEVYAEFHEWDPMAFANETREGHVIRISSLTKVFGFGPLRIGWVLSSAAHTEKLLQLTNYTYAVHGAINERLGLAVWEARERFISEARRRAQFNLEIVRRFLSTRDDMTWVDPKGGILGFVRFKGIEDTLPFAQELRESHGVMMVPGHFFDRKTHVRIGFGNHADKVRQALSILGRALDARA